MDSQSYWRLVEVFRIKAQTEPADVGTKKQMLKEVPEDHVKCH